MEESSGWKEVTPRRNRRKEGQGRWRSETRGGDEGRAAGSGQSCRSVSGSGPRRQPSSETGPEVQQSLETKIYEKHFKRVACPFCRASLDDTLSLAKHLDESCKPSAVAIITTCQLQTDHTFACELCDYSVSSVGKCLSHLYGRNHLLKCRKIVTGKILQLMLCQCCKAHIPCTYVQIQLHLGHEVHRVKRESVLTDQHTQRGVYSIYCLKNSTPLARCLFCSFQSDFLNTITHIQKAKHLVRRGNRVDLLYCCFCDEKMFWSQVKFHLTTQGHRAKEKEISVADGYELCLFCGTPCNTLEELSLHVRSDCVERGKIREEVKEESPGSAGAVPRPKAATAEAVNFKKDIDKGRSITVKADIDVVELYHVLKNFGKIRCVEMYDEENIVIEFNSRGTLADVMLVQSFIKVNGEKVNINFFMEQSVNAESSSNGN